MMKRGPSFVFWIVILFLLTTLSVSAFNVGLTVDQEPLPSGGEVTPPPPPVLEEPEEPVPPVPLPPDAPEPETEPEPDETEPVLEPESPVIPSVTPETPSTPVVPPVSPEPPISPIIPPVMPTNPIIPTIPTTVSPAVNEIITSVVGDIIETTRGIVESPVGRVATGIAKPLGIVMGVAFVATQAIIGTGMMTVSSISDIYLLFLKLIGFFGAYKRKGKPWGTVYDSITKRPLDPAYVVVSKSTGEEVGDAITDLDGRYGFLIPVGTYRLKASKTNYTFPTVMLVGKTSDEIYDSIYHGEDLVTKEGEVIIANIPLDPIGFDWNEFAKNKQNLFRIYSEREIFWNRVFGGIYATGLLSAIVATFFDPGITNFIFLFAYSLFIVYSLRGNRKKAVVVRESKNSMPVPFAVVKVFFAEVNNQVKTIVADHLGRFYLLVGPGRYYITIDEKQLDGTYKTIHKTEPMYLKNGVLDGDILI